MQLSNTCNVGVIGVGALGRHHARLYQECPNATLVGLYDASTETANKVATEFETTAFATLENLLENVEAVSVAVPTDLHFDIVKELLQKDKHVLVEKPITADVDEAEELVAMAEARNLVLAVGHVERYNPVLASVDKVPGAPRFIEAHRLAAYPPSRPGMRPRGTEVSVILDLMIHDIDVILSLVQSQITEIRAVGVPILSNSYDIANARLEFENGCVANLTASRISASPMRRIRVFKSNVYLGLDYGNRQGEMAYINNGEVVREPVPVHETNPLKDELQDFCQSIVTRKNGEHEAAPKVCGVQGLAALRIALQISEVIETHSNSLSDLDCLVNP
jgi:predicted dehydrogenase